MSQLLRAMQVFRSEMVARKERLRRGACATILVGPIRNTQFVITASWTTATGIEDFSQAYTVDSVFKRSGPRGVKLRKKHCRFADDFIRDVLITRGVIT